MILYCAADAKYFDYYFRLWADQACRFYPEMPKLVAVHGANDAIRAECARYDVTCVDATDVLPSNPTRRHFYLLRWLCLPYQQGERILETQINCLAVNRQDFPEQSVDQIRISRIKRGKLGGVSAAIFSAKAAKRIIEQAQLMLASPPESDHPMNTWQVNTLSHLFVKAEQQFKAPGETLDKDTCWITAGTSQKYTAETKLELLRSYI